MQEPQNSPVSPDAVRVRAYELWERYGRPEGREMDFWLQAERDLEEIETASAGRGGAAKEAAPKKPRERKAPAAAKRAAAPKRAAARK